MSTLPASGVESRPVEALLPMSTASKGEVICAFSLGATAMDSVRVCSLLIDRIF